MTFELGINYWPRRSAMYMWREFDIVEIRDEMAHIAALGFDVVRVFTMAPDFLPEPLTVATDMVARLVEVARAAKDAGLKVVPTLIVVNMSGHIWWPQWMLDPHGRPGDLYSDPTILRSQALLAETCARALSGDAAVRAFDLANEIDDAQRPQTKDAAWVWASVLAHSVRRASPATPVRIGAHLPSLTTDNNMRIDDLATVVDEDVMHAYPLYCNQAQSFLDPELVPFACALTSELAGRSRGTIMQEFGLCTAPPGVEGHEINDDFLGQARCQYLASEEEAAVYYETVLDGLAATGAAGAYGWCYGDYDARLFDRPPFKNAFRERTFGLVRADGSEKPAAAAFRNFKKTRGVSGGGASSFAAIPHVLDMSAEDYYRAPDVNFERLYAAWLARAPS
ncbi:MAG: glycoside hydrolase 5 family protein [Thermoanaerobaculia bacterium]